MPSWTPSFGKPETKEDDDVLQHIHYYTAKARVYDQQGEHEAAAEIRVMAEEYRAEAERRGLLLDRPGEATN